MNDQKSSDELGTISRKQGFIVGAIAAAIFIASVVAGFERIGTALALSVLVIVCVGIICWPLRSRTAFYLYLALISGIHLIVSFTLADSVNGKLTYMLVPFIFIDIFLNVYLLKAIVGPRSSN
jgi:hypothetical protein